MRKNRATGETPSKALLGYEAAKKGQWEIPEFRRRRRLPRDDARARRRVIRTRQLNFQQQTYPNMDDPPVVTFNQGQPVMIKEHNTADPFLPAWAGPYPIAKVLSPTMYEVDKNGRQVRYHIDHIRPAPLGNPSEYSDSDEDDSESGDSNVGVVSDNAERPVNEDTEHGSEDEHAESHGSLQREACKVERRSAETDVDYGPSTSGKSTNNQSADPEPKRHPYHLRRNEETKTDTRRKTSKSVNMIKSYEMPIFTKFFYRTKSSHISTIKEILSYQDVRATGSQQ